MTYSKRKWKESTKIREDLYLGRVEITVESTRGVDLARGEEILVFEVSVL
ncbi:hypothetical protein Syun_019561 [Stephania yunnanensis]|uniref:Uncharacterized protein n=1 Tax=Stephania yunnanensis TaxID=152371 RepID=A0AAP0NXJ8_9MAGN